MRYAKQAHRETSSSQSREAHHLSTPPKLRTLAATTLFPARHRILEIRLSGYDRVVADLTKESRVRGNFLAQAPHSADEQSQGPSQDRWSWNIAPIRAAQRRSQRQPPANPTCASRLAPPTWLRSFCKRSLTCVGGPSRRPTPPGDLLAEILKAQRRRGCRPCLR